MRQNPHVRICGGPGSATTLVYPTADSPERIDGISAIKDQVVYITMARTSAFVVPRGSASGRQNW